MQSVAKGNLPIVNLSIFAVFEVISRVKNVDLNMIYACTLSLCSSSKINTQRHVEKRVHETDADF